MPESNSFRFPLISKIIVTWIFLFGLSISPFYVCAQETDPQETPAPKNKKQRQADKKKAKQKQKGQDLIESGLKRHMEIQTKEVQQRMKRSQRKAERNNRNKKKPFFQRLFSPDRKHRKVKKH